MMIKPAQTELSQLLTKIQSMESEQIAAVHLTNDVAVLRCTIANRSWLICEDQEIETAFAVLSRKMHEMINVLNKTQ